jgi:hypothetical protein
VEEDVHRLAYLVVVLIDDRNVEKAMEHFAVDTPGFSVGHPSEGPGHSHSENKSRLSPSDGRCKTRTVRLPLETEADDWCR